MYKMDAVVRYSECGNRKQITLPGIINYFQDCSSSNSERLGVGMDYLMAKRRAWVLNPSGADHAQRQGNNQSEGTCA